MFHSPSISQLLHYARIPGHHRTQKRIRTSRSVELVLGRYAVLQQHGHAMQLSHRSSATQRLFPLFVGLVCLIARVWVDFQYAAKLGIEGFDPVQVEVNQLPRSQLAVVEGDLNVGNGGVDDGEI